MSTVSALDQQCRFVVFPRSLTPGAQCRK